MSDISSIDPQDVTPRQFTDAIFSPEVLNEGETAVWSKTVVTGSGRTVFPSYAVNRQPDGRLPATATHISTAAFGMDALGEQNRITRSVSTMTGTFVLVLDDVGEKVAPPALSPSWIMETSPPCEDKPNGSAQWGYILEHPIEDAQQVATILQSLVAGDATDKGGTNPVRLFRLPGSKPKGKRFAARLVSWHPERLFDPDTFLDDLGVAEVKVTTRVGADAEAAPSWARVSDPVLAWLRDIGWLESGTPSATGYYDIICPWADMHSDDRELAGYKPATSEDIGRSYRCHHGHGEEDGTRAFLDWVREQGGPDVGFDWHYGEGEIDEIDVTALGLPAHMVAGTAEHAERVAVTPQRKVQDHAPTVRREPAQVVEEETAEEGGVGIHTQAWARVSMVKRFGPESLPDCRADKKGAPLASQPASPMNIEAVLDAAGATKRFNVMTREVEWWFDDLLGDLYHDAPPAVQLGGIKAVAALAYISEGKVGFAVEDVSAEYYHPMEVWIDRLPAWDGTDWIAQLAASIPTEDKSDEYRHYTYTVVKRWLVQAVQAVKGWRDPQQVPHVLIFSGSQGAGKTRWFMNIAPREFTLEGATLHFSKGGINAERDAVTRITNRAIVELGELETTFSKSEQGDLKNFLAATGGSYRLPYARSDVYIPRATVFGGTVNRPEVLRDGTGARRWWPVMIEQGADLPAPTNLEGIWAQALALWEAGEPWFLTDEEAVLQKKSAEDHKDVGEVDDLMNEEFPNGFVTVPMGEQGKSMHDEMWGGTEHTGLPGRGRVELLTVTQIMKALGLKGLAQRSEVRDYVRAHGGDFAKNTDQQGKRRKDTCIALPDDHAAAHRIKVMSGLKVYD